MKMQPFYRQPYRQGSRGWNEEQVLTLNNFGGGLNNVEPESIIADNEMVDTKNMRFISESLMEKRFGTELVGSTYTQITETIGEGEEAEEVGVPITWVDMYYPLEGEPTFVRATDKEIYVGNTKLCDVSGRVKGVNYIGKYYFVDGSNIYVYDGSTYYKIVPEPFSYLTEDVTAATTVLKVEEVPVQVEVGSKVFFLSSIVSWDDGDTAAHIVKEVQSFDAIAKTITLTSPVGEDVPISIDTKKSPIYFYEPKNEEEFIFGEEEWDEDEHWVCYYPCVVELASSYSGSSYIPDSPSIITVHASRLFVSGDSKTPNGVFMSGYTAIAPQPLYFPSGSMVSVKPNGQAVVDLIVFDNALIIGRHEDMFVLYGNSVSPSSISPFYIKQMDVSTGLMGSDCGALLNNYYIYLGYDGSFYKLNTPTTFVEYLMTRPLGWKCDIYSAPFNVAQNSVVVTSAVAYRNEVFININNDFTIVYSFNNMGYTYYSDWGASALYTDGSTLYLGTDDGNLVKYCDDEDVYTDRGVAIESILKTKRFDFGQSANYKYFKRYMVTTQTYDVFSDFTVDVDIDYFKTFENTLTSNKTLFGVGVYGDIFNNKDITKSNYIDLDYRGRSIQFTINNSGLHEDGEISYGKPFRLYDINLLYSIRDVR